MMIIIQYIPHSFLAPNEPNEQIPSFVSCRIADCRRRRCQNWYMVKSTVRLQL